MWPSPTTPPDFGFALFTKGIAHAPDFFTPHALRFDVDHFTRGAEFVQPQFIPARCCTSVGELHPGKIVQVTIVAGHQETGWHHRGWFAGLGADPVDIAAAVHTVRIEFELEEARVNRREQAA